MFLNANNKYDDTANNANAAVITNPILLLTLKQNSRGKMPINEDRNSMFSNTKPDMKQIMSRNL